MTENITDYKYICLICESMQWSLLQHIKNEKIQFDICICEKCGFIAQIPPPTSNFLSNYYKKHYNRSNYKATIPKIHETMQGPTKFRINYLRKFNVLEEVKSAIEIGPGSGTFMKMLSSLGIYTVGIEADTEAVSWIRDNLGVTVYEGFFDEIYELKKEKWIREQFDLVAIIHLLEHIIDPVNFLKKISTIMSENGKVIIEVPNGLYPFSDEKDWQHYCDPGHLYYYSINSLNKIIIRSGFKIMQITVNTYGPYKNILCLVIKDGDISEHNSGYDCPDKIKRIWRRFIRYHKVRYFLRYGVKSNIRKLITQNDKS